MAAQWMKGGLGERQVGTLLDSGLPNNWWRVHHDLPLGPAGRNVDHLVFGPTGAFVIDTKTLGGSIEINGNIVVTHGFERAFVERVTQDALEVRDALLEATNFKSLWVQPVLAFVDAQMQVVAGQFPDTVKVCQAENLVDALRNQWTTRRLDRDEIDALSAAARKLWRR